MIQIYCGAGKGKTSAAIGATVRAAGNGVSVIFAQFFKSDSSGEISVLQSIDAVSLMHVDNHPGFFKFLDDDAKKQARTDYHNLFEQVVAKTRELASNSRASEAEIKLLVVLDEIMGAVSNGAVSEDELIEFVAGLDPEIEVIMTGRNPSEKLIEVADYVSEVCKVKHPFDKGITSRIGVEM